MRLSHDRILVSHVGSLPRNEKLADMLIRQEAGEAVDTAELSRQIEAATAIQIIACTARVCRAMKALARAARLARRPTNGVGKRMRPVYTGANHETQPRPSGGTHAPEY